VLLWSPLIWGQTGSYGWRWELEVRPSRPFSRLEKKAADQETGVSLESAARELPRVRVPGWRAEELMVVSREGTGRAMVVGLDL
jgi:hypothetical protein